MKSYKSKQKKKLFWSFAMYSVSAYISNRLIWAYRTADGDILTEKMATVSDRILKAFTTDILPSFNGADFLGGIGCAVVLWYILWSSKVNKKKFEFGREHGSANWGTQKDIAPFVDYANPDNNIILTATESLTMDSGHGADDRNKNVLIVGAPGTGKTLFFMKPNIMQMHCSYAITDPKGNILKQCGKMLARGRIVGYNGEKPIYQPYKIKVFNTVDFSESMHYNPFHYFRKNNVEHLQLDIGTFVDMFIANTKGEGKPTEQFWVDCETMLYTAYISAIFVLMDEKDINLATLCEMVTCSQEKDVEEGQPHQPSNMEIIFQGLEKWIRKGFVDGEKSRFNGIFKNINFNTSPTNFQIEMGQYAVNFYKRFKSGAKKTLQSIIISCSSRIARLDKKSVLELVSKDDLELDKLGHEYTALFIITSDTNKSLNFLVSFMYTQLFDLLCEKALKCEGESLPIHIRFLLDEFANLGKIPHFEETISVIRSRNMSTSIVLQSLSQLETAYEKKANETIIECCDSILFLGGSQLSTLKWFSEMLGKETIDTRNYSTSEGTTGSFSKSDQKSGRDLMTPDELRRMDRHKCILIIGGIAPFFSMKYSIKTHKNYRLLSDYKAKNKFSIKRYISVKIERRLVTDDEQIYGLTIFMN